MRAWKSRWARPVVWLTLGLVGCQHAPANYPADPLLVSKKPILSQPVLKPPSLVNYAEPEAPAGPVMAVAAQPAAGAMPALAITPERPTIRGQVP